MQVLADLPSLPETEQHLWSFPLHLTANPGTSHTVRWLCIQLMSKTISIRQKKKKRDEIQSEPGVKKMCQDQHQETSDRRRLKLEDAVYLGNISPAAVTKQPINSSHFCVAARCMWQWCTKESAPTVWESGWLCLSPAPCPGWDKLWPRRPKSLPNRCCLISNWTSFKAITVSKVRGSERAIDRLIDAENNQPWCFENICFSESKASF